MKKFISLLIVFSFGLMPLSVLATNFDVTGKLRTSRKFRKQNPNIELGKKTSVNSDFEGGLVMDLNLDGSDLLVRVDVPEGFNDGNVAKRFKDIAGFEIMDQEGNVLFGGESKVVMKKTNKKKNFTKATYRIKRLITMPVKFQNTGSGPPAGDPPNPFPDGPLPEGDILSSTVEEVIQNIGNLANIFAINTILNIAHTLNDIGFGEEVTTEEQFLLVFGSEFLFLGLQGTIDKYFDSTNVDGNNCVVDLKETIDVFGELRTPPFIARNGNKFRLLTNQEIAQLPPELNRNVTYNPTNKTITGTFVMEPNGSQPIIAIMEIILSQNADTANSFDAFCNALKGS